MKGRANLTPALGVVGFQDRTLGQMLQVPLFDGEPMTTGHRPTSGRDEWIETRWWWR